MAIISSDAPYAIKVLPCEVGLKIGWYKVVEKNIEIIPLVCMKVFSSVNNKILGVYITNYIVKQHVERKKFFFFKETREEISRVKCSLFTSDFEIHFSPDKQCIDIEKESLVKLDKSIKTESIFKGVEEIEEKCKGIAKEKILQISEILEHPIFKVYKPSELIDLISIENTVKDTLLGKEQNGD